MNKIMSIFAIVSAVVLISTTVIFAQSLTYNTEVTPEKTIVRYENIEINDGDCLSVIAEKYNTSDLSTKEFTKYLKKFNNLKSDTIYYGDSILVPIFSETN